MGTPQPLPAELRIRVFSRAEIIGLGLSDSRLRARDVEKVGRGLYRIRGPSGCHSEEEVPHSAHALSGLQAAAPQCWFSYQTACEIYGLPSSRHTGGDPVHISLPPPVAPFEAAALGPDAQRDVRAAQPAVDDPAAAAVPVGSRRPSESAGGYGLPGQKALSAVRGAHHFTAEQQAADQGRNWQFTARGVDSHAGQPGGSSGKLLRPRQSARSRARAIG